jgi:hypothetical protein
MSGEPKEASVVGLRGWQFYCVVGAALAAMPCFAETLKNPLPLTRITLVSDIDAPLDKDDPGTGGSFDNSAYFQNKLADEKAIAVCVDQIEASSAGWAKSVGLSRSFRERQPTSLSLHYGKPDLPGIFTVNYTVTEKVQAKVRVDFYRLDGSMQSPEAAKPLLTTYQIASFQDSLDKALQCKAAKS